MVFFIWIIIRSHGTNMLRNILCLFLIWSCRFFFHSNNDYRKLYEDGTHTIESKNMFHVSKCPRKSFNNKVMDWHGKNAVNLQIANYMAIYNRLHNLIIKMVGRCEIICPSICMNWLWLLHYLPFSFLFRTIWTHVRECVVVLLLLLLRWQTHWRWWCDQRISKINKRVWQCDVKIFIVNRALLLKLISRRDSQL